MFIKVEIDLFLRKTFFAFLKESNIFLYDYRQIGDWSEKSAFNPLNISDAWLHHYSMMSMLNKTLIVSTLINSPYCMLRDSSASKTGNERFEGYIVDLIYELSRILHFKYVFKLCDDGAYGIKDDKGRWNGLIGILFC